MNRLRRFEIGLLAGYIIGSAIVSARGAEKVFVLGEPEQTAMRGMFDNACRTQGLSQMCRNAFVLSDKLDAAGVLAEQNAIPPAPKNEPAASPKSGPADIGGDDE